MNHDKATARDLFVDMPHDEQIDKALAGRLTKWELPFNLRHRADRLTRLAKHALGEVALVNGPELARLIDTTESDRPDDWWYQWELALEIDTDDWRQAFQIDLRESKPDTLAHRLRRFGEKLTDLAGEIETMDW